MPEMGVVLAALPIPGGMKAADTKEMHANASKEKEIRMADLFYWDEEIGIAVSGY